MDLGKCYDRHLGPSLRGERIGPREEVQKGEEGGGPESTNERGVESKEGNESATRFRFRKEFLCPAKEKLKGGGDEIEQNS